MKAPNYDVTSSCLVCDVEFFDVGHRTFRRGVELCVCVLRVRLAGRTHP